jgi:hypothetical protein
VAGIGGAALDTEIFFTNGLGVRDRIAILKDTTAINVNLDFIFV